MTEHQYHYQSITEKRTGWRSSRWLLKLLILPIVWVCASEKRTWKNSILYFTKEFHNFTKEFCTLYIQTFPEFTQHYKKVFYHELSSPKNASKKRGRLVLFSLLFLQLLPLAVANDIKVSKEWQYIGEKSSRYYIIILHKKDTQRKKSAVGKRRNFEKLQDVQEKVS